MKSAPKTRPAAARRSRPAPAKPPALELRCHGRLVPLDPDVAELVDDTYRQLVDRVDSPARILSFALELGLAAYRAWIPVKAAEHEDETERAAREESLRDEIRELAPVVLTGFAVDGESSADRFRAVIYCTAQKRSFRSAERFHSPAFEDFKRLFVRCPFCWIEHSVVRLEEAVQRDLFGADDVATVPAASLAAPGQPLSGLVIGAGKVPEPVTARFF